MTANTHVSSVLYYNVSSGEPICYSKVKHNYGRPLSGGAVLMRNNGKLHYYAARNSSGDYGEYYRVNWGAGDQNLDNAFPTVSNTLYTLDVPR